jgi:hypothetical protein
MGVPRWLTAATLCLAVIFIIWLCLVIPANAPKQRVKMTKVSRNAIANARYFAMNTMEAKIKGSVRSDKFTRSLLSLLSCHSYH